MMFKPYSLFVGLRYALSRSRAKQQQHLVTFISRISIAGLIISVGLLITVLSVMNGFDQEMRHRILGLIPHISISQYRSVALAPELNDTGQGSDGSTVIERRLLQHPEVVAIAPFVQLDAMLVNGNAIEAIALLGIDPVKEKNVSIIDDFINATVLQKITEQPSAVIIGAGLAERLSVDINDNITVMLPEETEQGRIRPRFQRLTVVDILHTGTELDQNFAVISLTSALAMSDNASPTLRIKIADIFSAPRVAWELNNNIPYGYHTSDWTRTHGNLYGAIQLSKQLVGIMLLTIIAVAAFNIISALVMIVNDKRGDIAILRTNGASRRSIMFVFLAQGAMIGLLGTGAGVVLGVLLSLSVTELVSLAEGVLQIQLLNTDVYPIDYVPSDLRLADVLTVALTAFIVSMLAAVYPAWRAARVLPAAALRHQ